MGKLFTTTDAAIELKVSVRRVQAMIKAGILPAERLGRDWFIKEKDLEKVKNRKPGRPKKT